MYGSTVDRPGILPCPPVAEVDAVFSSWVPDDALDEGAYLPYNYVVI